MFSQSCIADTMSRLHTAQDAASKIFHKEALVQQHETAARSHAHLRAVIAAGNLVTSYMSVAEPRTGAPLVSLQGLQSIRLRDLIIGCAYRGRVLYGTLCVNPFKDVGVMTVLEDDQGLVARVAVYNVAAAESTPAALNAKYPKGTKVAIKEPYVAIDGGVFIKVENPANLVRVTEVSQHNQTTIGVLDLEEECGKGNECFRKKQWLSALIHYPNCIRTPNNGEAARTTRLLAYSNRAETYLQMGEFQKALEDCNQSLQIDPGHMKTLVWKSRFLYGLKDYAQACQVLQTALRLSPGQAIIDAALRMSKACCARSRQREYSISDFLLGMQLPGEVGDFIGDVEIKKTSDGRGRGLYATENISIGELFLVSNAVAIDDHGARPFKFDHRREIEAASSQEALVAAVMGTANKSQELLQQLYALDDGSEQVHASTPAMDLFDTSSRCQETPEIPLLQLENHRIRDIVSRNSLGGVVERYAEAEISASGQGFRGLWLMPSFINHSCLPNATRLNVGRAMFLHAAKPIEKGEEITISYFDALLPLPQREATGEAWGFNCNYKRCALEKSLNTAFKNLNAQFEELHNIALDETNAARSSGEEFPTNLPESAKFAEVYEMMEEELSKSNYIRMNLEEKNWVRASYVAAYWAGTQSNEFFDKTLEDPIPSGDEILQAVVNTVPGDLRTLAMAAHQAEGLKYWVGDKGWAVEYCATQARDACVRVLGKHSEHIIEALVHRHAKSVIF